MQEDGRQITVTLPTIEDWTVEEENPLESTKINEKTTTSKVCYVTTESASWGRTKYYYHQYDRTTKTWTETAPTEVWSIVYHLEGWKIGNKVYKPGETVTLLAGNFTATPVCKEVSKEKTDTKTMTCQFTEIQDKSNGTTSSTGYWEDIPSGYTKVNQADIHETPYTTDTGWK